MESKARFFPWLAWPTFPQPIGGSRESFLPQKIGFWFIVNKKNHNGFNGLK